MSLVRTNRTEFTDMFRCFYENCPPELEKAAHITPSDSQTPPAALNFSSSPDKILMNLDPHNPTIQKYVPNIYDLCKTIASDFYVHTRDPFDYEITSVHLLRNPIVWEQYQAEKKLRRKSEIVSRAQARAAQPWNPTGSPAAEPPQEDPELLFKDDVLFHGTQKHKLPSILLNGLDPKMTIRANYGKGCYFSDTIEKCMQYVDVQKRVEQEYSIILCCVLLGRVMVEPYERVRRTLGPHSMYLPDGYHSAMAHDSYKEWIVFEKSQILPLCVINFKASNKPESHYRLSQFNVLFKPSLPYSIGDIPRVCTVPTPVDNNKAVQQDDTVKSGTWREPDVQTAKMLQSIFGIEKARVCNIHYPGLKEWVISATNGAGEESFGYLADTEMTQFIQLSKNINLLHERMEASRARLRAERTEEHLDIQRMIQTSWVSIDPHIVGFVAGLMMIQEQFIEVEKRSQIARAHAAQFTNNPRIQAEVLAHEQQWRQVKDELDVQRARLLNSYSAEHLSVVENVLRLQKTLARKIQEDEASLERQLNAINIEKDRLNKLAISATKAITREGLELRITDAKKQFDVALASKTLQEDFQLVNTVVTTSTVKSWPLIVSELLLPSIMINQLSFDKQSLLNLTGPLATHVPGQDWWALAPQSIYETPVPSYLFWPLDPRRRIPNRRFFQLKDYIEWIFLEKENRIRKHRWRHNQTGNNATSEPPADMLQHDDATAIQQYLQQQWDHLDPTILRSIGELSSRHGRVIFNRAERQKELDQMGTDLLNALFVQAEPHMLIWDSSSQTGSSTQGDVECPICKDALEIPDPNANSTSQATSSEPEKVVKLKSCRHCFHEACIKEWFNSNDAQLKCPMCNTMCTTEAKSGATKNAIRGQRPQKLGPMPDGVMGYHFDTRLCCYFIFVVMPGHFIPNPNPNGVSPRIQVPGDVRYVVLPVSARLGPLLLIRLITLFYYGHMFRVGRSLTRGVDNVVVWNGVHLRTSMKGEFGFPAPNFERNCWEEINQKGVAMGLDELILSMLCADGSEPKSIHVDTQLTSGVDLPASVVEEISSQALTMRMFDPNQPLLFK
ncbi:putative E3 ubiquitin-protein ligase dtx2 [Mortierella sp. NVP85]|nr:putative E3 ubiquitin-protein ligase dtx2 [Mortierella sp. NVP85]